MYRVLVVIVKFIYRCMYNVHYEGPENIPQDRTCVYASNHRSYTDPILISLAVKKRFAYMAKEELFQKNIFFTALIKFMGAFPVVRGKGDTKVIDTSIEKLEGGRNLVIFPEGTRSYDGKVGKGKSGVALIAAQSGRDVVPVGIVFEGEKLKFRKKVTVKYGKPIKAEDLQISGTSPAELKALKQKIMGAIKELVEGEQSNA
ncbi:MAG: lysophospholipid acyltransferase family protein [Oscillospiraceae bacterium]